MGEERVVSPGSVGTGPTPASKAGPPPHQTRHGDRMRGACHGHHAADRREASPWPPCRPEAPGHWREERDRATPTATPPITGQEDGSDGGCVASVLTDRQRAGTTNHGPGKAERDRCTEVAPAGPRVSRNAPRQRGRFRRRPRSRQHRARAGRSPEPGPTRGAQMGSRRPAGEPVSTASERSAFPAWDAGGRVPRGHD